MVVMLGIDTGGTYTDAVLLDVTHGESLRGSVADQIVAHAKAATTHHDLAQGVRAAVVQVLNAAGPNAAADVALVSVSTTLATNALVEGHGEPAGLLTFGFSENELRRTGIAEAMDTNLVVALDGGHDAHGNEKTALDLGAVEEAARALAPRVSAFAVAAQFSVRNPAHEQTAATLIRSLTGRPVTSSHELSAKLNGPRRALTAALNARLIGTIDRLNRAVAEVLAEHEVDSPIMVVRGDGSLVSAAFAGERPIETILSGPAASVIGALYLGDLTTGLVADIGGTTTDVALITNGRPAIASGGAVVGGHRTMVEAVDMVTAGLGGDSEVRIDTRDPRGPVLVGPERAIPICRLARDHPEIHNVLDRQLGAPMGLSTHGRFFVSVAPAEVALTDHREIELLAKLRAGPLPFSDAASSGLAARAAQRLQARGLIRVATMTPTDACAVNGTIEEVDREAADKVAKILARQTGSNGAAIALDGQALAEHVIDVVVRRSADFALRVALGVDGFVPHPDDVLLEASLRQHTGAASVAIALTSPITAIGAPAAAYYDRVARLAGTTAIIPPFSEVANAVGAVVGQVRVRRSATITQPTRGQYRVHLDDQPTFGSVENAHTRASEMLSTAATADAVTAGADTPELTEIWEQRMAIVDGKEIFVEGTLTVEASGRPRF